MARSSIEVARVPWIVVAIGVVAVGAAAAFGVRLRRRPERSTATGKPLLGVGILFMALSGVLLPTSGPTLYATWFPLGVVFLVVGASQMARNRENR